MDKQNNDLAEDLVQQAAYLESRRGVFESHWTEIAERMDPMSKPYFQSFDSITSEGDKRNQEILDSTPVTSLRTFIAIMDYLITPRNQFWHQLKPSDRTLLRDKNTMNWFSAVNNILFEQRYSSKANFSAQNQLQYKSLGAYGTGGLFIDALDGVKGIRYRNIHLSELFLQENHQGVVDRFFRRYQMTARQCKQKFSDKCPKKILEKVAKQPEQKFKFIHWILPRSDRDPQRKDFKGMEYASYYIFRDEHEIVMEGGYRVFPAAISRYEQSAQEAYGRSPGMDALPAIKTLNKQKETLLKQGQLATDPVLLVHDDGILDGASVESGSYLSGAISADGRLLAQPLPVGRFDVGKEMMDDERAQIRDTLLVNLFQILTETPEMTAQEVIERTREKGILLAPMVGRQQSEYLGPIIEREIDVLMAQGLVPPMPLFLKQAQGEYTIDFDSPITRSQKAEWAAGAVRTIEVMLQVSTQTQDPSKLFYINWDKALPEIAAIYGTPSEWLSTPEEVQQLKQSFAQQQQMQNMIQAAPAAAGVMKAMPKSG